MTSKEERVNEALSCHKAGYNCAQSVLMAVYDKLGATREQVAAMSAGFGGGVGGQGEICGVCSALAIAEGLLNPVDPKLKPQIYRGVRELCARFKERNNGMIRCRDLKQPPQPRSCDTLIADGVKILCDYLDSRS